MSAASSKPRWGILAALLVTLAAIFGIAPLVQIGLYFAASAYVADSTPLDWLGGPLGSFLFVLLTETLTVSWLVAFIRSRHASLRAALGLYAFRWRDIASALMGMVVYFGIFIVAVVVLDTFVHLDTTAEQDLGFKPGVGGAALLMAGISLVLLAPIAEELLFRGFFYGTLRERKVPIGTSILLTSLIFASLHLLGGSEGKLLWLAMVDVFSLSLVLCYLRERNGTIWASILLHMLKNGLTFVNLFVIHSR